MPFEKLVEELGVERSLAQTPLFQVMFVLQNNEPAVLELGRATVEGIESAPAAARFDLALHLEETDRGIEGALTYRRELWDAGTMARLLDHFGHLLEEVAAHPERRLSGVSLLRAAERAEVLEEWNATRADYPRARLHEWIAAQAARTPGAVAVVSGGESLTYAALDHAANQVAHALVARGVGPEVRVGICLERGARVPVAILGVLKAGGAYVPLDPAHPAERLRALLLDAGAPVLLTQESLAGRAGGYGGAVLRLDADRAEIAAAPGGAPPGGVEAAHLAYVIYTSGSTGAPKGVLVEHRQLANYVHAAIERIGLHAPMRYALVSTPAADLGNTVLFPALCTGGTLHVLSQDEATVPVRFAAYLERHQIDVVKIVPAHLAAVAGGTGGARGLPRRVLVLGGEASRSGWVRELKARAPGLAVVNHYGPTETTVGVLTHRVEGTAEGETVPLGRPLGNTRVYVLDGAGEPAPPGVPGELYVGGAQVGRGYLGRAELTAGRFLPDPFSGEAGARLYRTGDRTRRLPGGGVEFLGRTDQQVKVRGFRVEPGEIEAVLRGHPGVRDAVVLAREDAPQRAMLVAYLVPAGEGGAALVDELRANLRGRLPEPMVPAAFVLLDALPLSASGKTDRRALPAPRRSGGGRDGGAPLTATERALAAIWEDLLGVGDIGVGDNFFDLGGHSLLLVQAHSRLQERFPDRVALVDLFTHRTLGALATHLDRGAPPVAPGTPGVRKTPAVPEVPRADAPGPRPDPARGTDAREHHDARPPRDAGADRHATTRQGPMRAPGGNEVAIIGMAGRFPGARDVDEFWRNLRTGVRSLRRFTEEELAAAGVSPREFRSPGYVPVSGVLEGAELFDAAFFGLTPREAMVMNPQQRVFLECAWEALERAGYASRGQGARMGVFASRGENRYMLNVFSQRELARAVGTTQVLLSNGTSVATLTSHKLGLKGPSMNVQTACSSSLVAVHVACRSLLGGETDVALAGGVRISVPQDRGYRYRPGGILSPTGECTPFD
ncbi:MAG TPA: amino acid adenylation domain-containing protein, partial [Longimicrobiaceae bacterium]|nr:amino acid adenylation domain-containing protein [Longimicrobiaceae bacterium]